LKSGNRSSLLLFLALCLAVSRSLFCEGLPKTTSFATPSSGQVPQVQISTKIINYPMVDGTDIRFSRPNAPQGLSLTKLGPIVQDNQGFLWFGSQHGLYRFDGYSFKAFVHDPGNSNSLSGVFVSTLFKDRNGALWVGCDRFLDRLDLETETFTHYPIPFVVHISQDKAGLLWLSTPSGLYALDPTTGRSRRYAHNPDDPLSLSSSDVRSSGEDREGRFWVSNTEGMDELDRSSGKVLLHIPLREPSYSFAFYEDRLGTFWIYRASGNPLAVFDTKSNTLTEFSFNSGNRSGGVPTSVTAMIEDQNGTLWLGTIGAGLLKLDREHHRFIRYRNNVADKESIGEDSIGDLALDREGIMWAALGGMGLTSFAVNPLPFKRYRHDFGDPNSKGEPFVGAIFEDENGTLWIGAHEALNRIDQASKHYASYHIGGSGDSSDVIAICEDRSGNLWLGTYGHGLFRFDRRTARFKRYRHDPADKYSLSDDIVPRLLVDHNGILWAATDDGLDRFDKIHERFTTYWPSKQERDQNLELVEDRQGVLWLGTNSSGLQRFDPTTGQFTTYENELNQPRSLSDNRVNSIHVGGSGTIWVGTQDGLDEFDPKTGQFTTYNRREGLPGNTVGCVLEDDRGNLWMSTNNGVATFDVRRKSFKGYSIADGLPGLDLTGWGACFKSSSGEMFFGGFAGATSFFPDKMQESSYVPPIVLTDFTVFGTSAAAGNNSVLKKPINYTESMRLTHEQNIFSIGFSALSYANPEANRYRYMLEGLDRHWNEVGSDQRLASYTTLPAGFYMFRVEGAKGHGAWTEPGRELTIEILPPWWRTAWFQALCVFVFLLLLWGLYELRLRQLHQQFSVALEARVSERTRIARELHDTLLQSLHGVMFQFQAARNMLPKRPEDAMRSLDNAILETEQAIAESRDAIHELRTDPACHSDLAELLTVTGQELTDSMHTDQQPPVFELIVEGERRPLSAVLQGEVYRIGREILRNAFQHAHANRIEAEIRYDDQMLRLRIRDDGIGIDPEILDKGRLGHWGLRGIRERAQQIGAKLDLWSQAGAGTEVQLTVPAAVAYDGYHDHSKGDPSRPRAFWGN
jgi:signal transduction histidine kinase/ligand-binding sensor domain-containing protein